VSLGNSVEEIITLIGDSQRQAEQVNQIDSKSYFISIMCNLKKLFLFQKNRINFMKSTRNEQT